MSSFLVRKLEVVYGDFYLLEILIEKDVYYIKLLEILLNLCRKRQMRCTPRQGPVC